MIWDWSVIHGGITHTINPMNFAPTAISATGMNGTAVNSDGGNASYYQATDGGALIGGLTAFTIESQFSLSNVAGIDEVPLFSYNDGASGDELEIGLDNLLSIPRIVMQIDGVSVTTTFDPTPLLDGSFHTVSVTWDNTAGDWALYVDGSQVDSGTGHAVFSTLSGGGELILGQEQDALGSGFNPSQVFQGTLYDVRVFDDARTPAEIAAGAGITLPVSEPGLLANWLFDEAGTLIPDVVGGNDLTFQQVTGVGWTASTPQQQIAIAEGALAGTVVADLSATDPNAGDTFTYTITSDPSGFFAISGGQLVIAGGASIDYDVAVSHDVTIQVQDSGGLTFSQIFTVGVLNTNMSTQTIDLDVNYSGTGYTSNYIESSGAQTIVDPSVVVTDNDDSIANILIQMSGITLGPSDQITVGSITFTPTADIFFTATFPTFTVELSYSIALNIIAIGRQGGGSLTVAETTEILQSLTYENLSGSPTMGGRDFSFSLLDDNGEVSTPAVATLTVVPIGTPPVSPIAFDLSGDGIINITGETTAQDKSLIKGIGETVQFDMDGDGDLETIEWLDGSGDALLVDNRDGQAASDMNGTRLFGDQDGELSSTGLSSWPAFDANGDQVISGQETAGLNLWVDDGDALVEEGELFTLEEMGISEIQLELQENATDEQGRDLFRSGAIMDDGSVILTEDVWFAQDDVVQPDPHEVERIHHPDIV